MVFYCLEYQILTRLQVYVFKNIRYAKNPTGNLRWRKPEPPEKFTEIQDDTSPRACTQTIMKNVTTAIGSKIVGPGREDCLFLDLVVPKTVIEKPSAKLPVLTWIHGGYYSESVKYLDILLTNNQV
jgi:carboxylesterase type B